MKRCAVIGSNGFLGKALVLELFSENHVVIAVYNHRKPAEIPGIINIHISEFIQRIIPVDVVFFAAGSFSSTVRELADLHCLQLKKIVDTYLDSRIVFISSANVYGMHQDVITETSCFNVPTPYGMSKLTGEFVTSAAKSYAIIRPVYLYGKGLSNRSFIPNLIDQAISTGKITLFGKGERRQDYLHVKDVAKLCLRVMEGENITLLAATGQSYSNLQVAEEIVKHIDKCSIEFSGSDQGNSFYFDASVSFAKSSWQPVIELSEGIKEMFS